MAFFKPSTLAQCKTLLPVLVIYFTVGMGVGWASPALYKLNNEPDTVPFKVSENDISWIASINDIGLLVGTMVGGFTLNRLGRRYTVMLVPITLVIRSVVAYFGNSAEYLYVARFSGGMALTINYIFNPIYIAEVSTPVVRGPLTLIGAFLFMSGSIVEFAVGPSVSWDTLNIIGIPPAILGFVLAILLMHESPYFLAMKGRYEEMTNTLMRLRGATSEDEVKEEAASIQAYVAEQMENATSLKQTFSDAGTKRAALIVLTIQACLLLSGNEVVMSFGQIIFNETGSVISDDISVVVMFSAVMVGLAVSSQVVNSVGRRPLLIYTLFGCGTCLTGTTIFLFLKEVVKVDVTTAAWVPLVLLVTYGLCSGLGAYTVPEVLAGELLDQRTKSLVGPVGMIVFSVPAFVVSNVFVRVSNSVGMYVLFIIFSVVNLFAGVFCAITVPETKGKTLIEVQDMLRGRTRKERV